MIQIIVTPTTITVPVIFGTTDFLIQYNHFKWNAKIHQYKYSNQEDYLIAMNQLITYCIIRKISFEVSYVEE